MMLAERGTYIVGVVLGVIERTFSMLASTTHDRILEKLLKVGHVQEPRA